LYPHPQHVVDFLAQVGLRRDNLGLVLEKFIDWFEDKRGNYTPNKREYFAQASKLFREARSPETEELAQAFSRRWQATLARAPFPVRTIEAEALWYFVSGKGSSDLIGELLYLHQNFAVPVIRGSAIKGSARAYARDFLLPEGRISEEKLVELFGNDYEDDEVAPGALTFFDAIPLSANCLKVTAITNQSDGYYSGKEELMCRNNVIPLFHLAAPPNTPFLFAIGSTDARALELGEKILRQALRKNGTGANTRVGYGYFKVVEDEQPASAPPAIESGQNIQREDSTYAHAN